MAARPQPSPYKGEGGWPKARRMRVPLKPHKILNKPQKCPYGKAGEFPVFRRGGFAITNHVA